MIYAKDRAIGKDAQRVEDILEEIQTIGEANEEDNEVESMHETNEAQGTNDDTSVTGTNGGNGRTDDISSKKKKSSSMQSSTAESIMNAARMLGKDMKEIGKEISKSIGVELTIQQKAEELFGALDEIEGLTLSEKFTALRKILKDPTQMLIFFSLPFEYRLQWMNKFLMDS